MSTQYPNRSQGNERGLVSLRSQLLSSLSPSGTYGPAGRYLNLSSGVSLYCAGVRLMNLKLVMSSRNRVDRAITTNTSSQRTMLPFGASSRELVLSIRTDDDWEILIYRRRDIFEACFFRWAIHHEHATGSSFEAVSHQVEQRIRTLKARRLKTARWRSVVH